MELFARTFKIFVCFHHNCLSSVIQCHSLFGLRMLLYSFMTKKKFQMEAPDQAEVEKFDKLIV